MSRSKKTSNGPAKRKAEIKVHQEQPAKIRKLITPPPENIAPKTLSTVISEEELEITIDTLQTLAEHPSVLKTKACQKLRAAVYDFRQASTTGTNNDGSKTNLTARISAALTDAKYTEALVLLAEMRIRKECPKLGALCRWTRELDVVGSVVSISGLSLQVDGVSKNPSRSPADLELLRVLDAILRVTGPVDLHGIYNLHDLDSPIAAQEAWNLRDQGKRLNIGAQVEDGSIFTSCASDIRSKFRAIETTPGASRRPPNSHPAIVYSSTDLAVALSPTKEGPQTTFHSHPQVPNLSLIKDVLTSSECSAIIAACESVKFLPDAPIRDDGSEASVLAHNVYWLVDQPFHDILWNRVKPFVPAHVSGRKARGINRRFRVYRYVPGAEYRCHIDGAWPPSGKSVDASGNEKYHYDVSAGTPGVPKEVQLPTKQSSLFTFLMYLNDEFEGGETTFFLPSVREGILNSYSLLPVMGAVAVFPHGENDSALLHEGTGVRSGCKYIVRTDVEYDVEAGFD